LIKNKIIQSAHDVSEGGLFVTLAESSFNNDLGFNVAQSPLSTSGEGLGVRPDAYWFGEAQSRVVVSVREENISEFEKNI
ncbi:MAG: AIR synthase-related protein, partial [Chitinophagaceae bacterium]